MLKQQLVVHNLREFFNVFSLISLNVFDQCMFLCYLVLKYDLHMAFTMNITSYERSKLIAECIVNGTYCKRLRHSMQASHFINIGANSSSSKTFHVFVISNAS